MRLQCEVEGVTLKFEFWRFQVWLGNKEPLMRIKLWRSDYDSRCRKFAPVPMLEVWDNPLGTGIRWTFAHILGNHGFRTDTGTRESCFRHRCRYQRIMVPAPVQVPENHAFGIGVGTRESWFRHQCRYQWIMVPAPVQVPSNHGSGTGAGTSESWLQHRCRNQRIILSTSVQILNKARKLEAVRSPIFTEP